MAGRGDCVRKQSFGLFAPPAQQQTRHGNVSGSLSAVSLGLQGKELRVISHADIAAKYKDCRAAKIKQRTHSLR